MALDSVFKQVNVNIEVIVINDNSNDDTDDVLKRYSQLKIVKNRINMGPSYNRKLGYLMSSGDYVVFMDDDDYYIDNNYYFQAIHILENMPSLAFITGNSYIKKEPNEQLIQSPMNISGYMFGYKYLDGFQFKYSKPHSTFTSIFRRKILDKAGLKQMEMVNDSSIYMKALSYGDAYIFNQYIGVYRIHKTNISKSLDYRFVIQNLKEKGVILNQNKKLLKHPHLWWLQQYRLTYNYFMASNPSKEDEKEILKWGKQNLHHSWLLNIYLIYKSLSCK